MRVSESFTLANDMTCSGDGMVVVSDNVTVDLGGHTLTGPGMGPQTWPLPQLDSVGVRVGGHTGVTIRNGKTTAFSTGIYFIDMVSSSIESVTTLRNRFGFYIHASQKITVKDSDVEFNIYGLHLQNSDDCVLVNNLLARQTYNSPGGYGLYLYASARNRVTDNTIDSNINWGIWFSDAKENVIFHNNVVGNNPPVSDNTEGSNVWYDKQSKEGNWWADYKGKDGDNDSIGDSPYPILGPGGMVDPYPFVAKDGWKTKRRSTIDHYEPAAARPPRAVTVIALAGGSAYTARPGDDRATLRIPDVSQIAMGTDERTLYAASGKTVMAQDIVTGETRDRSSYAVDGIVPRGPHAVHHPARRRAERDGDGRVGHAHLRRDSGKASGRRRGHRAVRGRGPARHRRHSHVARDLAAGGHPLHRVRERRGGRDHPRPLVGRVGRISRLGRRPRRLAERRPALRGARRPFARDRGPRRSAPPCRPCHRARQRSESHPGGELLDRPHRQSPETR